MDGVSIYNPPGVVRIEFTSLCNLDSKFIIEVYKKGVVQISHFDSGSNRKFNTQDTLFRINLREDILIP